MAKATLKPFASAVGCHHGLNFQERCFRQTAVELCTRLGPEAYPAAITIALAYTVVNDADNIVQLDITTGQMKEHLFVFAQRYGEHHGDTMVIEIDEFGGQLSDLSAGPDVDRNISRSKPRETTTLRMLRMFRHIVRIRQSRVHICDGCHIFLVLWVTIYEGPRGFSASEAGSFLLR